MIPTHLTREDFAYDLPSDLIAHAPLAERSSSRLLHVPAGEQGVVHRHFAELVDLLTPGDLIVFNDTRVIPARLFAQKDTGGQCEVFVERVLDDACVLAHLRASKAPKVGQQLLIDNAACFEVIGRDDALFKLQVKQGGTVWEVLHAHGHVPLPPYIKRPDNESDKTTYQTIYAKHKGAVAAPTAGLHFDEALFEKLAAKGIEKAFVTLHVGAGTFQPVRVSKLADHHMHQEWFNLQEDTCEKIKAAKARGNRVVAVGTTVVRVLESAAHGKPLAPFQGETNLFIYPGYEFQIIDAMITNFHLPESTLLMLVSAFAGMEKIKNAYQAAIEAQYRFFSYGDAMFLERDNNAI